MTLVLAFYNYSTSIYKRAGILSLLMLFLHPVINAQSNGSFTVSTNASVVTTSEYFSITYTFKNIKGGDFRPPSFKKNFLQIGNPSRATSTSMINGHVTHEEKIMYQLRARRQGTFTISPAYLTVNNQEFSTDALTIKVVEQKEGEDNTQEVFIRAEPSTLEAFIGQQILLDYTLYTTVDVQRSNILEESEYQGFFVQEIRRFDNRPGQVVEAGVPYTSKVIRRLSLFPQQTGTLTVTPFSMQLGIPKENSGRRQNLFFNREIRSLPVSTGETTINIRPLPDGAPESFSGAVGNYQQLVNINRRQLTTDDALTITITIMGDGDIKRVQAPNLSLPESFELYDPKVLEETTYETNGQTIGKKVFEYLAVPTKEGQFQIQPTFSYFSPDSVSYKTLAEPPYLITVRPGSGVRNNSSNTDISSLSDDDIGPLKLDTRLYKQKTPFHESPLFWILAILPFLLLGSLVSIKLLKNRQQGIDPTLLRSKQARKMAAQRLTTAEQHMKAGQSRAFYDEISKAFLGYACDKLNIPRSSLSKDGLRQKLQELNIPNGLIDTVMEIIRTSEMALFAGQSKAEDMQGIYDKSLKILAEMEEVL